MLLTKENINKNIKYAQLHYEDLKKSIENFNPDIYKKRRIQLKECKTCFYLKNN